MDARQPGCMAGCREYGRDYIQTDSTIKTLQILRAHTNIELGWLGCLAFPYPTFGSPSGTRYAGVGHGWTMYKDPCLGQRGRGILHLRAWYVVLHISLLYTRLIYTCATSSRIPGHVSGHFSSNAEQGRNKIQEVLVSGVLKCLGLRTSTGHSFGSIPPQRHRCSCSCKKCASNALVWDTAGLQSTSPFW